MVLSLRLLMQQEGFNKEKYLNQISSFVCKKDSSIVKFLREQSFDFEKENLCRTYIVAEDSEKFIIKGFFSLAVKPFIFASEGDEKCFPLFLSNKKVHPSYLLGQIAKCDGQPKEYGDELLKMAVDKVREAQNICGGRILYLDYKKKKDKLKTFYEKNGFNFLQENPDKRNYNQMYIII